MKRESVLALKEEIVADLADKAESRIGVAPDLFFQGSILSTNQCNRKARGR